MLPWTGLMIFYGTTMSSIHDAINGNYNMGPFGLTAMIVGSVVAIIASIFLSCVVKRHANKMVADANKAKEEAEAAVAKEKEVADREKGNPQTGSVVELGSVKSGDDKVSNRS